jgi:hypothetical protein
MRGSSSLAGARHTPGHPEAQRLLARPIGRGLHNHTERQGRRHLRPAHRSVDRHAPGLPHPHFLEDGVLIGYAAVPPGLLAGCLPAWASETPR